MQKEFEDSYNAQAALLKHAQVQELVRVTDALEQVKADVASFEGIVDTVNANQKAARELHLQTAAILALQELLAGSSPLGDVVPALKKRLSANELVVRTLDTLSARGLSTGIATSAELRLRFKVVRKEVRKASLIPEFAPNFLGQAVGSALASISWRPADGSKVDKTTINSGDIEDQLASVAYYLDLSDLPAAVKECDNIKGYPRLLMADWEAAVKDRMAADLAVSVLKSEMSLKHQQMSKL
jgi:MICOS complex subunit MIC60